MGFRALLLLVPLHSAWKNDGNKLFQKGGKCERIYLKSARV